MLKSTFAKYLIAFVIIIFTAFLILSGIITALIRNYVNDEVEEKLELTSSLVVEYIVDSGVEKIDAFGFTDELAAATNVIINFDTRYDVLVSDTSGKVFLTSVGVDCINEHGKKEVKTDSINGFTYIDLSSFSYEENDSGTGYYINQGDLGGYLAESSVIYASEVIVKDELKGYVFALCSTSEEDQLVAFTRRVVSTGSVWVMLASVIAAYFITERIVHPLKTMTSAAKNFAKGDFSSRVTVYGRDEVAELANAFNHMAESLDSLEKMRSSFLANVSHDLRTPMTTISGFIDGITSGAIPPEKHDYYLGVISAEVHRLSRLVSQLLDISKLESGERKFNFVPFDIAELSRIILISFEQKIEDKRLDVEFESDDEVMVIGDKDAIHQVVYNLCHNAIKFSREEGKFRIRIERLHGGKIQLSVFDEGETVSSEDVKLLFDRFYKTDKSRGLDKSGVGLGLYICKTIIDAHEEKIWVESTENVGTEFFFTLKDAGVSQKRKALPEAEQ